MATENVNPTATATAEATPATVETVTATPETTATENTPVDEAKDKRETHDQRRWSRLVRERAEAKAQADFYKSQFEATQQQSNRSESTEPRRDQFTTDAQYAQAVMRFEAQKAVSDIRNEFSAVKQQDEQQTSWNKQVETFKQSTPDYDEVLSASRGTPVPPAVADAVVSSDVGPALEYELAKNPDLLDDLSSMTPIQQVKAIGRLEAKILAKKETPATVKASSAPAPIKPVGSKGKSEKPFNAHEWIQQRNKEIQNRYTSG